MNTFRWDALVYDNLLKDRAITGVSLISRNASCLYSVGKLQQISQKCMSQFSSLFTKVSKEQEEDLCQNGITLMTECDIKGVTFHIYNKTNCRYDKMKWIGHLTLSIFTSQITLCLLILLIVNSQTSRGAQIPDCSRAQSKVAREILKKDLYPVYKAGGWEFPQSCPLQPSRDMFSHQEERKWNESPNRWYCNYCGKAFTSENNLDGHFTNRHSETIVSGEDAVCLADYCDYLRCDIISGAKTGSYWDKTLCKQTALEKLKQRCEAVIKSCLPDALSGMHKHELRDKLKKLMCSSLTCEGYWEAPSKESSPHGAAAYAIVTCILIVGLILYYIVAYTHFYTDSSLLNSEDAGVFNKEESEPYLTRDMYHQEIRNRYQQR